MPTFVSERTEETLSAPTEGASVELVARVDSDQQPSAQEWIAAHDGTILDTVESGLVEFELPEIHVATLCDLEYVHSVERGDEAIEVLDQGN